MLPCTHMSPLPACVNEVLSVETDVDLLAAAGVTVVVSGRSVQMTRYLLPKKQQQHLIIA